MGAAFVLAVALLPSGCINIQIEGTPTDGGTFGAGGTGGTGTGGAGGSGGDIVPRFAGGRHPASWRAAKAPITGDVPRWFVPKVASRFRYPLDRTQSPIPGAIAEHLRDIALHGTNLADNVFMKVGDSISDNQHYLGCFKGDINNRAPSQDFNIIFGGHDDLAEAIFHFRSAKIEMTSPFDRQSKSTRVGAAVTWPLEGAPAPLDQEYQALNPQFASTMFGTNDLGFGGSPISSLEAKMRPYQKGLVTLIDTMLERGVVPWLSTIPPRIDDPQYMQIVPLFNAVIRGVAEGRQIPLVDFNRDLLAIDGYGLGTDGVHPNNQEYNTACHLDAPSLAFGYNVRNFGALTMLDRLMKVVVDGVPSLDDGAPQLAGDGSGASPFVIDALPFSDMRDTRDVAGNAIMDYSGCSDAKAGAGAEYMYRLDLAAPTALRAVVLDGSIDHSAGDTTVDLDVYLLDATKSGPGCIASADSVLSTTVGPGTFYIVVDTAGAGPAFAGEYTLAVTKCEADDDRCGSKSSLATPAKQTPLATPPSRARPKSR